MSDHQQASVDPRALRELAQDLSALAAKIIEMGEQLDLGLAVLGQTFQDDHYDEFKAAFRASRQTLEAFAEEARRLTPSLNSDADDIEQSQRASRGWS